MKKGFIVVLFALIASVSYAQIPQLSWNVKAGMNISNWTSVDDSKARVGFKIGGGAEYAFNDLWSLQGSLFLTTKGAKIDGNESEIKVNQIYLEVPVMGAARFNVSPNTNVVLSAGPYFAYGIGGKTKVNIGSFSERESTFSDYGVKRFDMGIGIGAAVELGQIILGLEGQYGFLKTINFAGDSPKNINMSIVVGYKF